MKMNLELHERLLANMIDRRATAIRERDRFTDRVVSLARDIDQLTNQIKRARAAGKDSFDSEDEL